MRGWPPQKRMHLAHHADVAQAVILAMAAETPAGRVYNVGDDSPATAAELLAINGDGYDSAPPRA
jgi:nucleoside-diphosphate-sugar epimerase